MSMFEELLRQRRAPVPWADMVRAVLAICVPLSAALLAGKGSLGVLPAMGGLLGTLADTGGPYLTRLKRVASATVIGGAGGLAVGSVIHGQGWLAVAGLVLIAGVSSVLSSLGDVGSVTGLQLLVYAGLGLGPVGAQRPAWHTAAGFLLGVAWALILIVPGWLLSPRGKEQRDVAAVYLALAAKLTAIGTPGFAASRRGVTAALNTAYDELLAARSTASGRNRETMRLVAALNSSHLIAEASTALGLTRRRPPPLIIVDLERLAEAVRDGAAPPVIPPAWDQRPAALALRDAMAGAARALSSPWSAAASLPSSPPSRPSWREPPRDRVERLLDGYGHQQLLFTIRLMACVLVASVVSEVEPLQRSYWVPLTVAIVFKPDYGSVFARAIQRGVGTVIGAAVGAALLALVHGLWLLVPFAVLAALLPFGRSRNYGLLAVFLTPLVVILIDLLTPAGWLLAEDRLLDTLIGCGIVVVVGFLPWWSAWYAHLPRQFATTAGRVADYLDGLSAGDRGSRLRRTTYRALADLRAEFQRTMSEPPSISARASAWWPAVVGLEQVMDTATALAVAVSRGARVPLAAGVHALSGALREASAAAASGSPVRWIPDSDLPSVSASASPSEESLAAVTESVKALLGVLRAGGRLTVS